MTNNCTLQNHHVQGQLQVLEEKCYPELLKQWQHLPDKKNICKDKNTRIQHKIRLVRALVITIFLYACETWTLTAELQRRIQSLEFGSRKILGISYKDRITNEFVWKTTIKHTGPYEYLTVSVKRRDNIAEWTGKSFPDTQGMAHNRQEWV